MERDIQKKIREKLREIEEKEPVFILRAVKQASGEGERRLQNAAVRQFIEEELRRQKQLADQMKDDRNNNWEALNRVFLELLKEEQRQEG
ncbi:putative uncharacterized protein [Clostridium sp. CAG:299]|nr:putative uncharacterized protein [Clostridium sp. CAG:299]